MPSEVMIKGDWWKEVKASAKPKYMDWPAQTIEVEVEFPKELYAKLQKDPLLLQKLSDGGSTAYKAFITACVGHVGWAEGLIDKAIKTYEKDKNAAKLLMEQGRIDKGFNALMSAEVKKAPGAIEKGIDDAWAKYKKTKKDYRDYKIRAAAKIGLKLAAIGFSIAALVGSYGANVLAWRSLIKDTIKTIDELVTLAKEAEAVRVRAEKTLGRVLTWHAKVGDGKGASISEVGFGLLKVLIGTDAYMTIEAVMGDVKALKNKLGGLDGKAHEAARYLQKLLDETDALKRDVPPDLAGQLAPIEANVSRLIDKVIALQAEIKDSEVWAANMTKLLTDMSKAKGISELQRVLKGIETVSEVALSTNGWVAFSGDGAKLAVGVLKDSVTVGKNIDRWMDDVKKLMA